MRQLRRIKSALALLLAGLLLAGCAGNTGSFRAETLSEQDNTAPKPRYLRFVGSDSSNVDPQCTSGDYTVALNVFDRLVEVQTDDENGSALVPSLAESWTVSPDGLCYTFRLHEGVRFSDGSLLTAGDVLFTMKRLLTYPDSVNGDIAMPIHGAAALRAGLTQELDGFRILSDTEFEITLAQPYAAFLANLSTPGASILSEAATLAAGESFGRDAATLVGTGPFIFRDWVRGDHMTLEANPACWSGAPRCGGLEIRIVPDPEQQRLLFTRGELDILDLENIGDSAEYFIRGETYRDKLCRGSRVGITYIALNESVAPLDNADVRRALQLALDRNILLTVGAGGRGLVENGIFPHGLIGFNPELEEIPCDPAEARRLLEQAGYGDGFDLTLIVDSSAGKSREEMLTLVASMWESVGVHTTLKPMDENDFIALRKQGLAPCYCSTWSADFNDPDNFIYTFFGNEENTRARSLCYGDSAVMERVHSARAIAEEDARLAEYRALEQKIVREDAAWIPLYSAQHYFAVSDRVEGFKVSWNGWSSNRYQDVALREG